MRNFTNGHYYSLNQYLREQFGCKVYKLALSGGYTCPNRDGSLGSRGCIFCSEGGSGEFAAPRDMTVSDQIEQAKLRVKSKIRDGKFIAYFQSFTTTYMPPARLEALLREAIENDSVCALSVGTRPDCLPDDVVTLLAELSAIKPVWVELGLQTIHARSAQYIRRGYPLGVYDSAVTALRSRGLSVITHVILGLPGESHGDMLASVRYAAARSDGIKLQLLHILRGTDLADEYYKGKCPVMTREEYIALIGDCVAAIPENVVIHRLTGDGDKRLLIAPMWSADKKAVLNALNRSLEERGIVQGAEMI